MKITKHSQLPVWYDLEKYVGTCELDAQGWWRQIRARRNVYIHLMQLRDYFPKSSDDKSYEAHLFEIFLKIVAEPLAKHKIFQEDMAITPSACSIPTFHDLRWLVEEADVDEDSKLANEPGILFPSQVPVFLNLAFSNQTILQDLQDILDYLRSQLAQQTKERKLFNDIGYRLDLKPARKRKYDLSLWSECGLLPYMDLRLWEVFTGHFISWKVISEATDNRESASIDQTRQTVDLLAKELLFEGDGRWNLERLVFEN